MGMSTPSFAISARPERRFHRDGVEYEGELLFICVPATDRSADRLKELVAAILSDGPYRYGDFLNLPMALYLVRDDETGDVFRVSVRDGTVRLHVLPTTEADGLRAFYRRLVDQSAVDWRVDRQTNA
jgi:hypothetical protein